MRCNEANFIIHLHKGNEAALEYIAEAFLPAVKGAVYHVLAPQNRTEQIEECIQDVFISVWYNRDKFSGTDSLSFKKWIYKIAKFKAIDYYRKSRQHQEISLDNSFEQPDPMAEDALAYSENKEVVQEILQELDEIDQKIIIMKYFLGMQSNEIADKLSTTRTAIDNRIYRSKKRLLLKQSKLEVFCL